MPSRAMGSRILVKSLMSMMKCRLSLVNVFQHVFSSAKAYFLGMFEDVEAMLAVDPLLERGGCVSFSVLVVENQIDASLVQGTGSVDARNPS